MFLLTVQRIYLKSLCIKLAKVHLEGTGMGLPGIRHEHLNCWLVGGMPWSPVTYKCCWSILNHSTNLYSPPDVLCIPTYSVWDYSQSTLISIYAVSSPDFFKDLRFLGSYLKAKKPLICWVSQLVKRPERQTQLSCLERHGALFSVCTVLAPILYPTTFIIYGDLHRSQWPKPPFSMKNLIGCSVNLHAGLFPNYLFKVILPMLVCKILPSLVLDPVVPQSRRNKPAVLLF